MKHLLAEMLKNWWNEPLPKVRPRDVHLTNFLNTDIKKIITVTGFRRVGKTFTLFDLAKELGKERCLYFNFEDERLPQNTSVLTELLNVAQEMRGKEPFIFLLDEIQQVPDWSLWARRVNETTPHRLVLSGSSSKLSSNEIPTELRGHSLTVEIFPLSWKEFLNFLSVDVNSIPAPDVLNLLRQYLNFGGLPEIVLSEEGLKPLLLAEYFNTFVLRDVIERYKLRNTDALRELIRILFNTRDYTYTKLANTMKSLGYEVGKATIIRYMRWLESSYFLSTVELCSPSVKQKSQAVRKAYIVDTFFSSKFSTTFSQNIGQLMEQSVWQALKRKVARDPMMTFAYWRDYNQHEADFVVMNNRVPEEIIQVTYAVSYSDIPQREIGSAVKAAKKLACRDITVVTWEVERIEKVEDYDIKFVPLWKWLL